MACWETWTVTPDHRGPSEDEQAELSRRAYMWRPLDTAPATVHEVITRRMVEELGHKVDEHHGDISGELGEVRTRINGLIFLVIGAVIVQIVLKAWGLL